MGSQMVRAFPNLLLLYGDHSQQHRDNGQTTMSSDYGSDVLSDDISAIESSWPAAVAERAAPSILRKPLRERDANAFTTPPHHRHRKCRSGKHGIHLQGHG